MNDTILGALARPFIELKQRPGRNGQNITYVEGHQVVGRLNEAFAGEWDFKVIQHEIGQGEVIVLGELRAASTVKQSFGGSEITKTKDGKLVSVADDLKSAATDALKKAATLFGVGLHLYGEPEVPIDAPGNGARNGHARGMGFHADSNDSTICGKVDTCGVARCQVHSVTTNCVVAARPETLVRLLLREKCADHRRGAC